MPLSIHFLYFLEALSESPLGHFGLPSNNWQFLDSSVKAESQLFVACNSLPWDGHVNPFTVWLILPDHAGTVRGEVQVSGVPF